MNLRNLERIQERDDRGGGFPLGILFLAAISGGAIVIAVVTTLDRAAPPAQSEADPLAQLVAQKKLELAPAGEVKDDSVTFPSLLSDRAAPTTAMATVKDQRGRMIKKPLVDTSAPSDNLALELPRVSQPVGDLLGSTMVTQDPKDDLVTMARARTDGVGDAEPAPVGREGGYEIQVASFQTPADADAFVLELRNRGHQAYRQAAYVPDRGLWHRVRIGPFKHKYAAQTYRKKLEKEERISAFLVDPQKVKRAQQVRQAKLEKRRKKAERAKQRRERMVMRATSQ